MQLNSGIICLVAISDLPHWIFSHLPDSLLITISGASIYSVVQITFLVQIFGMKLSYPSGIPLPFEVNIWQFYPLINKQ